MRHTIPFRDLRRLRPVAAIAAAGITAAALLLSRFAAAGPPVAVSASPVPTATVGDAFGRVERQVPGDKSWKPVSVGDSLTVQTTVHTGDNSACLLRLMGGHVLRVGANTTVLLRQLGSDNQYSFKVLGGQVWSMVRKANHPARYEVETPSAVAGVTGTIFSVAADPVTGDTTVSTDEGSVKVRQGSITPPAAVTRGYFLRVGFAPNLGAPFRPDLQALPQDASVRHMWSLLRSEGVLVRAHETGMPGYRSSYRLQRRIEPDLFRDWRRSNFPMAPRPMRTAPRMFGSAPEGLMPGAAIPMRRPFQDRPQERPRNRRGMAPIGGTIGDSPQANP